MVVAEIYSRIWCLPLMSHLLGALLLLFPQQRQRLKHLYTCRQVTLRSCDPVGVAIAAVNHDNSSALDKMMRKPGGSNPT